MLKSQKKKKLNREEKKNNPSVITVDIFSKKTLICLSPSVEYRLTGSVLFTQIEDIIIWLKKIKKNPT